MSSFYILHICSISKVFTMAIAFYNDMQSKCVCHRSLQFWSVEKMVLSLRILIQSNQSDSIIAK
jgi:hypothetical protein